MNIACLGWGSLIWDPQDLPIQRCWFKDGPLLPIEYARHSRNNCITLVIVPVARYVRTLWTPMLTNDIDTAKKKIAEREGIRIEENITKYIAHLNVNGSFDGKDPIANIIGRWASSLGLDAVVWTNLPPKFNGEVGRIPTVEEVISFLNIQSSETKKRAEEYIRRSPLQIDTEYRRRIEAELNWTPLSDI